MTLTDDQLLKLWDQWSKETDSGASLMLPHDGATMVRFVTDFKEWLKPKLRPDFPKLRNSAELAMLREYKEQEAA